MPPYNATPDMLIQTANSKKQQSCADSTCRLGTADGHLYVRNLIDKFLKHVPFFARAMASELCPLGWKVVNLLGLPIG
jgi:hypothetical protein